MVLSAEQKVFDRRFFLLVSTFLPSRHDVFRNSTAAAVSCVVKFELIRGLGLICCEIKLIHGIEE